jgi:hypothetical protein
VESGPIGAFEKYTEFVRTTLRHHHAFDERLRQTGIVMLHPEKRIEFLARVVEQVEKDEPFRHLVIATQAAFPGEHYSRNDSSTSYAVKNFSRRSGFYLDVSEGKNVNINRALDEYVAHFQKRETLITRLTLLQGIEFTDLGSGVHFNTFQIRRFSDTELEGMFGNRANQVFYPWATVNVARLRDYWFVVTTGVESLPQADEEGDGFLDRLARAMVSSLLACRSGWYNQQSRRHKCSIARSAFKISRWRQRHVSIAQLAHALTSP